MRHRGQLGCFSLLAALILWISTSGIGYAQVQVRVINMIPNGRSGETNQDSEPNLAVNPANPQQIAGSAFTSGTGFCGPNLAPIYVSTNGGNTWALNCTVPSNASGLTSDITVRFSGTTNNLYAGILRRPGSFRLNILRTTNFVGAATMTVLVDRPSIICAGNVLGVDQPYVQATTVGGTDRVYVGDNDLVLRPECGATGRTATIDQSLNANAACCPPPPPPPAFNSIRIEARGTGTAGQDGPPIRPAVHPDGTVYAIFYGWRAFTGTNLSGTATTDVVVVRDDTGGAGATPFTALVDPIDTLVGMRVVQNRTVPWANTSQPAFGQERFVGSNISIATDPNNSSTVYIAWADRVGTTDYTLHVRRSLDRGVTWSGDLQTICNATNPALAINSDGTVGFLFQQVTGTGGAQRWKTHLQLTQNAFGTVQDFVLANVPANTPPFAFLPYIGDYAHLMAVGSTFYGIFSANNTPNNANFPNGVTYQRNSNFGTNTLLALDNVTPVPASIDPFFFSVKVNHPPVADAGPDQTVECASPAGTQVTLDGSASFDPDGDALTYSWTGPFPEGGGTVMGGNPMVTLPLGTHTITLTVTDTSGASDTDTVLITVHDTTAPNIGAVTANPNVLWPPNHKMVPVSLAVSVSDICDASPACQIISVSSNEPVDGLGDGDTAPDWEITGNLTLNLRAERSGTGTGRVYTITIQCTDASGRSSTKTVTVQVPHDRR